jgi:NAD(P)H-flavin reductase
MVSTALVHDVRPGDALLLGPPRGEMTVSEDCDRDLLCVAGGTGLAPIKAIIEGVISAAGQARQRQIALFLGARDAGDLYDMRDLETLAVSYPSLRIIPVVADDPGWQGARGPLPDAVRHHAACEDREVFISGRAAMVAEVARVLARRVPPEHIHHDPISWPEHSGG